MSLVAECIEAVDKLDTVASSYYDSRIEFSNEDYSTIVNELTGYYADLVSILDSLKKLSADTRFSAHFNGAYISDKVIGSVSFSLPRLREKINIFTAGELISLSPNTNLISFLPTSFDIIGFSILSNGISEERVPFVLNSDTSDYAEAGITVDWDANTLSLDSDVICISLVNNRASRESNLFNKLSNRQFKYWSVTEFSDVFKCDVEIDNYDLLINVQNGQVSIEENLDIRGCLVSIGRDKFFIDNDLALNTYVASTLPQELSGSYNAEVVRYTAVLKGDQTPVSFSDYEQNNQSSFAEGAAFESGDVITLTNGGVCTVIDNGDRVPVSPGVDPSDIVSISFNTQAYLLNIVESLPASLDLTFPSSPKKPSEFISISDTVYSLRSNLNSIDNIFKYVQIPKNIDTLLHEIKYVHLKAGFDNAYRYLVECRVDEYFSLPEHERSYGTELAKLTGDLTIKVQK